MYGYLAHRRRAWYTSRPDRARRLDRPVISIGNLVVGGSGKTPVTAAIAGLLRDAGERPAILSRGFGRRPARDGVVVVSDGGSVLVGTRESGDEPQMLARVLRGVPVLVSADRHLAGRLAETQFGCTVLLLDDGFQHFQLARDVDLLLVSPADLDERLLPAGTLREPLGASAGADALLVPGGSDEARRVSTALGVQAVFNVRSVYGMPRRLSQAGEPVPDRRARPAIAVAGIARPGRFFSAAHDQGWDLAGALAFRDHHWFTARDVRRIEAAAREAGAGSILTTEKDAVRLDTLVPSVFGPERDAVNTVQWLVLPLRVEIEPPPAFAAWLGARLALARERRRSEPRLQGGVSRR